MLILHWKKKKKKKTLAGPIENIIVDVRLQKQHREVHDYNVLRPW